jgi:hypothetical protein
LQQLLPVMLLLQLSHGWAQSGDNGFSSRYSFHADAEGLANYSIDIDPLINQQGVRYLNEVLLPYYHEPAALPLLLNTFSKQVLRPGLAWQELPQYAFRLMGAPAGGIGPPLAGTATAVRVLDTDEAIDLAMKELSQKGVITGWDAEDVAWREAGYGARKALAEMLLLIDRCAPLFIGFSESLTSSKAICGRDPGMSLHDRLMQPFVMRQLPDPGIADLPGAYDIRKLSYASRVLTEGIYRIVQELHHSGTVGGTVPCIFNSRYGKVGLFGTGPDTIAGDYALLLDLGGDDRYHGTFASASGSGSIGLLVDLGGDDHYFCPAGQSLACGMLGAGILVDLHGNDTYQANGHGPGSALYGFGCLIDLQGDDSYAASEEYALGAAIAGVGILCDISGNDQYRGKSFSQGFAGPLGTGILLDREGDDVYTGFHPESNDRISFVQGAARGRWAEATDGHSMGGGCGLLIDGEGNDTYLAHSFSQGASYYFGNGFLYDGEGNDSYDATSHSQGYAAHFALACLAECSGDDHYNLHSDTAAITQITGSGRDHSAGILVEAAGNDEYHFGNRSLGIGDMHGIGICLDMAGSDTFRWHHNNIYGNSPSMGTVLPGEGMMNFRLIPVKTLSLGLFRDYK